jgi:hypothetical protein
MNAFYGKTIQNPIIHKNTFVYGEEKHKKTFIFNSNELISSVKIREGMYMLKQSKPINKHFSLPHIGVEILSMSKRLMNEVICLAEDKNIKIYYQDTDSMHIEDNKVKELSNEFKKLYNRELIGKNLGQFHCDFNFKCDKDILPVAIESLFIAKKTYIDVIEHTINGVKNYSHHIRCKGIPSKVITNFDLKVIDKELSTKKEKIYKNKTYNNVIDLYVDMYKGELIEFDLLNICKFKVNKNFTFSNNKIFKRVLSF